MPKVKRNAVPKIVQIYWAPDIAGYRMWNAAWPSDTFERMNGKTCDALRDVFARFGIPCDEYIEID